MADNAPIDIIRSHQDDLDRESARQEQKLRPHSVAPEDEKYERDVPPDGGYGWVCVACVFWINAHTWGINSVSENILLLKISISGYLSCHFLH